MKYLILLVITVTQTLLFSAQYQDSSKKFKLIYDSRFWEVPQKPRETPKGEDVDIKMAEKSLFNLQRGNSDDKYHPRFSIVVDNAAKFKTEKNSLLVSYRNHAIDFMKSQRFDILSTKEIKLPNISLPCVEITAHQRDFGLTFKQVIFLKGEEAYLLTAATRTNKFDQYESEVEKMIQSIEFY